MRRSCFIVVLCFSLGVVAWASGDTLTTGLRSAVRGQLRDQNPSSPNCGPRAGTTTRGASSGVKPVLFGARTIEPNRDESPAGAAEAFSVRSQSSGTISSIKVFLGSRTKARRLVVAVYSDAGCRPGSRLTTGWLARPKAGAWNSVAVHHVSIHSGKAYWLVLLGDGGALSLRDSTRTQCVSETSRRGSLRSAPRSWTGGTNGTGCAVSAYAQSTSATLRHGTLGAVGGGAASPVSSTTQPTGSSASTPGNPGTILAALTAPASTAPPVITGTPAVGQTVTTSTGSWSGSPLSYGYEWEDCDTSGSSCSPILGALSTSYTLAQTDAGHTIRSVVTAVNATGTATATSDPTAVVQSAAPSAPSNTSPPTISGTAQQGDVLTAGNGSWSNSPTSYAYQWQDCNSSGSGCAAISGATSSSYTLTSQDVGDTVEVVVRASNAGGSGTATSAHTAVVEAQAPSAPSNTSPPTISGTAQQGDVLTAGDGSWSNSPTSYAYQWQDCNSSGSGCAAISGATSSSYTLTSQDVGDTVEVVVRASNAGGSGTATSAHTAVVEAQAPSAPSNTSPPTISGTAQQGDVLTAGDGSWSNSPTSYAYQWQDCNSSGSGCAAISGATSSSYTLTSQDVGDTVEVVVRASNAGGSGTATSAHTAAVTSQSSSFRTFYIDYTTGSDSNSGTSASSPWKDAPGMRQFSGSYTHQAGDHFIFKGGVDWPNSEFPLAPSAGGTAGNPDYYGVDTGWYSGSSFTRPIFDANSTNIAGTDSDASGPQDIFFDLRHADNVTVDDIEFLDWTASSISGGYGSCAVVELNGDTNVTINRILVTGQSIDSSGNSATCAVAFGSTSGPSYAGNSILENSTITGNGNTYGFGAWSIANVENNTMSGIPSMVYPSVPANGTGNISGNLLYNCSIPSGATSLHADTILVDVTGNPSTLYIHDNVIHDTQQSSGGDCESMWFGNPGETDYVWNNVLYNINGTGQMKVSNNNGNSTSGAAYIWDNSLAGADDGQTSCITGHSGVTSASVTIENNLCVTSASTAFGTFFCSGGGTGCVTSDHNVQLTPSTESSDASNGTLSNTPYEYAPTGSSSPTVGQGTSLASHCSGALASLCSDTTYGSSRSTVARPGSTGWDVGAYQEP